MSYVHIIVVREDLPHGVQLAQVAHAAGYTSGSEQDPTAAGSGLARFEMPLDTTVLVFGARSERELLRTAQRLDGANLEYHLVREPDAPWSGAAMALGVYPVLNTLRANVVRYLHLQLASKEHDHGA
jgi:hypothetical protein